MLTNDEAARVIALRAPIASDMRAVLTVIKISANLERCGDFAKNLPKRTSILVQLPEIKGAHKSIRRMALEVERMLSDALNAYIRRDAEMAVDVRNRDRDVDQMYNALFREFLTFMMGDPRNITACMHLHFIPKNIERMGDHVTSIADRVIYLITKAPADERPKGDLTSLADTEA